MHIQEFHKATERLVEIMAFESHCYETSSLSGLEDVQAEKIMLMDTLQSFNPKDSEVTEQDRILSLDLLDQLGSFSQRVIEQSQAALDVTKSITNRVVQNFNTQNTELSGYGPKARLMAPKSSFLPQGQPLSLVMDQQC